MTASVYFVPALDVTWWDFGPMNPNKGYGVGIPPLERCYDESKAALKFMIELTGGKGVIAAQSGIYCREAFYKEPFLSLWEDAVRQGFEMCLHTHEEVAGGTTTLNAHELHMRSVLTARQADLRERGLDAVAYRGGLYAYAPFLSTILPELGITIDLSAAPGYGEHWRQACWRGAPFSAYYMDEQNPKQPAATPSESSVLQIPIGADGRGSDNRHFLYIDFEPNDPKRLQEIWDACVARSDETSEPQWIHTLFHTISGHRADMLRRYEEFFVYCLRHGGQAVGAAEAKQLFDAHHGHGT